MSADIRTPAEPGIAPDMAPDMAPVTPMWIAGRAVTTGRTLEVRDPYRGDVVGRVPIARAEDVRAAVDAGAASGLRLTRAERARILRGIAARIEVERDEIAVLITRESGLSLKDSRFEVSRALDVLTLAADCTSRDDGALYAGDIGRNGKKRRIVSQLEPVGLVATISPFNHPLNQVVHKVAPAVAAGAPVVLKPSEKTPLTALVFARIAYEAGLPGAMLSVLTGDPAEICDVLLASPQVKLVSFTGSPRVGKALAARVGYRRVVMELGGNDPLIVMEDADLDAAAQLAVSGAFANSGQRCTAVKRILAQDTIADALVARMEALTRALVCGDPLDEETDVGTVIDADAAIAIERRIAPTLAAGARAVVPFARDGARIAPCLFDHVPPDAPLVMEETFGPVAPVIRFRTVDEALAIANGTAFGLSAGLCTQRLDWIVRFAEGLEVGGLNVGEVPGYRTELSPFGGVKDSGLGHKEGVVEAIRLYSTVKTISLPWF